MRAGVPPHRAPLKTPVGLLTRLSNLDLPRFDGRLDTWMGFIGLFESLVDSKEDLSPSQKLAYLLSVLDGEARGLVQHVSICDGSYEVDVYESIGSVITAVGLIKAGIDAGMVVTVYAKPEDGGVPTFKIVKARRAEILSDVRANSRPW
ncbi:unnamed protein product [Euphydryas editha]|uniref:Uncharacterized protein n=1 Tax=Euphydryas editha TaxID=104508 RepID=A0AAU9UCP3_EUPED|nr:unnamed protein product [Euphydryas editha]